MDQFGWKKTPQMGNGCSILSRILLHLFLLVLFLHQSGSISWLAIASVGSEVPGGDVIDRKACDQSQWKLSKAQRQLCKRQRHHMRSIQVGAILAIHECKHQFQNRRWNCSIDSPKISTEALANGGITQHHSKRIPFDVSVKPNVSVQFSWTTETFGFTLTSNGIRLEWFVYGTRESAFVHAISSAGVAHVVTRACKEGNLNSCGCDKTYRGKLNETFEWSGCSENVHYGTSFARRFLDPHEERKANQKRDLTLMNLHNNRAGRKVIKSNMQLQCKCHGVSGSCNVKTCWQVMPLFRKIGDVLKEKFDGATEVRLANGARSRRALVAVKHGVKEYGPADLVYVRQSPDYCKNNTILGAESTRGRRCNAHSRGMDGCQLMCCHRGYNTREVRSQQRCKCKFHWCCRVDCKICTVVEVINTCK